MELNSIVVADSNSFDQIIAKSTKLADSVGSFLDFGKQAVDSFTLDLLEPLASTEVGDLAAEVGSVSLGVQWPILLVITAGPYDPFVAELTSMAVSRPYLAAWDHL